jgi:hypothetical protein
MIKLRAPYFAIAMLLATKDRSKGKQGFPPSPNELASERQAGVQTIEE